MKLLEITKNKITTNKVYNIQRLLTEVVLIHCNAVNNDYQQDSRVSYTLLEISTTNYIFLKTFKSEFQAIRVWFTY